MKTMAAGIHTTHGGKEVFMEIMHAPTVQSLANKLNDFVKQGFGNLPVLIGGDSELNDAHLALYEAELISESDIVDLVCGQDRFYMKKYMNGSERAVLIS